MVRSMKKILNLFVKREQNNIKDGSIWEKDTSSHGGKQWKRWINEKSYDKGEKPNSIWAEGISRGTVRK